MKNWTAIVEDCQSQADHKQLVQDALESKDSQLIALFLTYFSPPKSRQFRALVTDRELRLSFLQNVESENIDVGRSLSHYMNFLLQCLRDDSPVVQQAALSHLQEEFVDLLDDANASTAMREQTECTKLFKQLVTKLMYMSIKRTPDAKVRSNALATIDLIATASHDASSQLFDVLDHFIQNTVSGNATDSEKEACITVLGQLCSYEQFELMLDFDWISDQMIKSQNWDIVEAACWTLSRFPKEFVGFLLTFERFEVLNAVCSYLTHESASLRSCAIHSLITLLSTCQEEFHEHFQSYTRTIQQAIPKSFDMAVSEDANNEKLEVITPLFDLSTLTFAILNNLHDEYDANMKSVVERYFGSHNNDNYVTAGVVRNLCIILTQMRTMNETVAFAIERVYDILQGQSLTTDLEEDDASYLLIKCSLELLILYVEIIREDLPTIDTKRNFIQEHAITKYKDIFQDQTQALQKLLNP